uniref:Uncharacterized protein n=1 Tax=Glossina pallidipes TaxID=7398 RepID=A0A1A9ZLI5_GLOPL
MRSLNKFLQTSVDYKSDFDMLSGFLRHEQTLLHLYYIANLTTEVTFKTTQNIPFEIKVTCKLARCNGTTSWAAGASVADMVSSIYGDWTVSSQLFDESSEIVLIVVMVSAVQCVVHITMFET